MVKINPGSNVKEDNETRTATAGSEKIVIAEPRMVQNGKFQCPVCDRIFNSRESYDSHALAQHPTPTEIKA